jgi:hypothetical protein
MNRHDVYIWEERVQQVYTHSNCNGQVKQDTFLGSLS